MEIRRVSFPLKRKESCLKCSGRSWVAILYMVYKEDVSLRRKLAMQIKKTERYIYLALVWSRFWCYCSVLGDDVVGELFSERLKSRLKGV